MKYYRLQRTIKPNSVSSKTHFMEVDEKLNKEQQKLDQLDFLQKTLL